MTDQQNQPQAVYTKQPQAQTGAQNGLGAAPTPPSKKRNKPKKLFGIDRRAVFAVIGLSSFVILAGAAVFVSMLQRVRKDDYSTTPDQSQAAYHEEGSCTLSFVVSAPPTGRLECQKQAYQDIFGENPGNYQGLDDVTPSTGPFSPGDIIVFRVTVSNSTASSLTYRLTDALGSNGMQHVTFLDSNCGADAYRESSQTLICNPPEIPSDGEYDIIFRVRVNDNTPEANIVNTAVVSTGDVGDSCNVTVSITPDVVLECGDECSNTDQCPQDHACNNGVCVLNQCITDPNSCEDDGCTPLDQVECGESCTNSTQCPSNHTCDNGVCALDRCISEPNSCESDRCTPLSDVECGDDCSNTSQCPNNHICDNGTCVLNQCISDPNSCESDGCTPINQVECGDVCNSDEQCPSAHTCDNNRCVYDACLLSGVVCDATRCEVIPDEPDPTPRPGCNEDCASNADCANAEHICWYGVCRLAANPNSTTCSYPPQEVIEIIEEQVVTQYVSQPPVIQQQIIPVQPQQPQPVMPEVLPQTGGLEGVQILGVGAILTVLGVILVTLL